MSLRTLPEWLAYIERVHVHSIDLGLERVAEVFRRLAIHFDCPVVVVGGTNGKGSTCALLESIFIQAGYRVGLYTSPHFLHFNERARVQGVSVSDESLIKNFSEVERVRSEISLTYFEWTTLAVLKLFSTELLDVVILEVGLGGRLDAVNVVDADVAIVTSVDVDHVEYLGNTREAIGFEKAGIYRAGKGAICADPVPPASLAQYANTIGADFRCVGRDFRYSGDQQQWNFQGRQCRWRALAYPVLRGANQLLNASAALATLEIVRDRLPVSVQEIRNGLAMVSLPGRFQVLPGRPTVILDVAHNPHAAATLAQNLDNMGFYRYTYAIFGMMRDKDIEGVIARLKDRIDHWYVTDLPSPRAASAVEIQEQLLHSGVNPVSGSESSVVTCDSPVHAYEQVQGRAGENDRIVVFGSFFTVAGVMDVVCRVEH